MVLKKMILYNTGKFDAIFDLSNGEIRILLGKATLSRFASRKITTGPIFYPGQPVFVQIIMCE